MTEDVLLEKWIEDGHELKSKIDRAINEREKELERLKSQRSKILRALLANLDTLLESMTDPEEKEKIKKKIEDLNKSSMGEYIESIQYILEE